MAKRLLLDTNILIDLLDAGRPQHRHALRLVKSDAELCTVVSSLKDVYYVLSKIYQDKSRALEDVKQLMTILNVLDLTARHAQTAIKTDEPDFDDGLVRAVAESSGVDMIVTRDIKAFEHSLLQAVDADQAFKQLCG